ncbi:M1 family aminopeptidase [Bacteroidota bacterium]
MKKILFLIVLVVSAHNIFAQLNEIHNDHQYCSHLKHNENVLEHLSYANLNPLLYNYDVTFYFLDIEAEADTIYIQGNVILEADVTSSVLDTFALELIPELNVDSVLINGVHTNHNHIGSDILVPLSSALNQGDHFVAQVYYHGTPYTGGFFTGISTAYSSTYDTHVTWTLSEPYAAKEWWPTKQDLQDKADSSWVFITTSEENMAGSEGLLTAITPMPDNKLRYEWKSRYPIDYYLISIAVADYQEYNIYSKPMDLLGDSILIQNFIYDHPDCLPDYQSGIDATAGMIELFSDLYGLYPFWEEKYGHCLTQLNGGMEHQTMTTIGHFGLALVSHELGHMWFGDNVTCATWSDIWVNEGFATYTDYLAHEKIAGPPWPNVWLREVHKSVKSQPGGSIYVPAEDLDDVGRIFSSRLSYRKGASIIHMIRYELMDDDLFFSVLQTFQDEFKDSVATGLDFKVVLENLTGKDFDYYFDQWYFGEGYPIYDIVWNQVSGMFNTYVTQSTSSAVTPLFMMTMPYKLYFDDGSDTTLNLWQENNYDNFSIPISKNIDSIQVDPDRWNLMEVNTVVFGIEEINNAARFAIGPNPANDIINIYMVERAEKDSKIEVCDLTGKILMVNSFEGKQHRINVAALAKGIYMLSISNNGEKFTRKFVKN